MSANDIIKLNDGVIDSWNRHDTKKFLTYCDEHIVWRDTGSPEALKGKNAAAGFFEMWVTAFPDFKMKLLNKVVSEDAIAGEIEFSGTNTGPLRMGDQPEIPATNRKVSNYGCYFGKVKNGKFTEVHTYPDMAGMMVQLGLHEVHAHADH
jgi:predicted ester cyclase